MRAGRLACPKNQRLGHYTTGWSEGGGGVSPPDSILYLTLHTAPKPHPKPEGLSFF